MKSRDMLVKNIEYIDAILDNGGHPSIHLSFRSFVLHHHPSFSHSMTIKHH